MPPKPSHQISLSTFLLVLSLIAVSLSHINTSYRYWRDEQQFHKLREQAGALKIENRSRIQALVVPALEANTWKWQLYLPPGRTYRFHVELSDVPKQGLPPGSPRFSLFDVPGDDQPQPLTLAVRIDDRDQCQAILMRPRHTARYSFPDEGAHWIRQPREYSTSVTQASFTVGGSRDPYVLFRLRAAKRPTEPGPWAPPPLADGLMVWTEPR